MEAIKKTCLYEEHLTLEAVMRDFAGYSMPVRYSSISVEHTAVREKAGLFDVSHMTKFWVSGEQSLDFLQYITTNDVSQLSVGAAQYTCLPNEKGGIIDDAVLYRVGRMRYLLVANAANHKKDWKWLKKHAEDYEVTLYDSSQDLAILALQGPAATHILEHLTDVDIDAIPSYCFAHGNVGTADNVIISNTGYTGSGGFELYVKSEDSVSLWRLLLEKGKVAGLRPAGLGARDTLRLEMGYRLYGQDIDDTTSPLEAGLGWITKFTKPFISDEYLKKQKLRGILRKCVGLVMADKTAIPRSECTIRNEEGLKIGEVSSGTFSPHLQKGIALGYVASAYSTIGTHVLVQIRNQNHSAKVSVFPVWKNPLL